MADSSSELDCVNLRYYTDAAQVFADVARRYASRPALVWSSSEATSYDELDRLSNQLARLLLARGARKRDPICLCLEKELVTYAAIVACLKLGLPYFVVDPANPPARTRTMIDRCRPVAALIGDSADREVFTVPTLVVDEEGRHALLDQLSGDPLQCDWAIDGSDPAYIMFTSGST